MQKEEKRKEKIEERKYQEGKKRGEEGMEPERVVGCSSGPEGVL